MNRNTALLLGLGSLIAWLLYQNRQQVSDLATSGVDTVTAALSGWQTVQQGPRWVPVLNQFEELYLIPTNLLARLAYQESRFRPDIISGLKASPVGALGLMQLMPQYFSTVNRPRPYSDADTTDQINEAAAELSRLFTVYNDWGAALAAYNHGQDNINKYLAGSPGYTTLPAETQNYVTEILADVPVASNFQVA